MRIKIFLLVLALAAIYGMAQNRTAPDCENGRCNPLLLVPGSELSR